MRLTVGVDEVGRGSWAGPLVAAAVLLDRPIKGLKDSKLLSKQQRTDMAKKIQTQALSFGLGWVTASDIDAWGLTEATRQAMQKAVSAITVGYAEIIIDGNYNFLGDNPKSKTIVKADQLVPSVSAASIIAKVARDEFMIKASAQFPEYGFASHVGYGTLEHRQQIEKRGLCALHRRSFKPARTILRTTT